MGAILALPALAFSAFCCCLSGISCLCTLASCLSCCFGGALGRKSGISPRVTKLSYVFLLGLCTILAFLLRFNNHRFDLGPLTVGCNNGTQPRKEFMVYCKGEAAVYRISFVLTTFFGSLAVLSIPCEAIHRGFWFFKILFLLGGIVGALFIPEESFDSVGYAWVARIGSVFFLVLQIMVLIDFAYTWNENWVERAYKGALTAYDDASHKVWLYAVLASAFALYALSITGIALLYQFYGNCPIGISFTTETLVFILIMTIFSLFRDKIVGVEGAILPVAVVSAYIVFLCWGALESNPDNACRPGQQTTATIVISCLIATITLLWTTFSVSVNAAHLVKGEDLEKPTENGADVESQSSKTSPTTTTTAISDGAAVAVPKTGKTTGGPVYRTMEEGAGAAGDDDSPVYSADRPWMFHIIMLCASMYLAMVLTNWGDSAGLSGEDLTGSSSMWAKIVAQWVTSALFIWTLVAPCLLSGRDFT